MYVMFSVGQESPLAGPMQSLFASAPPAGTEPIKRFIGVAGLRDLRPSASAATPFYFVKAPLGDRGRGAEWASCN